MARSVMDANYLSLSTDDETTLEVLEGRQARNFSSSTYHIFKYALIPLVVVAGISLWLLSLWESSQIELPKTYSQCFKGQRHTIKILLYT